MISFCLVTVLPSHDTLLLRWSSPSLINVMFFVCSMKSRFIKTYTVPPKNEISGMHNGNSRIWHFDLLEMAWHQPQTSIVSVMQISRVLLWMNNHLAMSNKSKYQNLVFPLWFRNISFFTVVCDVLWFGPWKLTVAFECKHINLKPHIKS